MKSLPPLPAKADQADLEARESLLATQCRILSAQLKAKGETLTAPELAGLDLFQRVAALDAHGTMIEQKLDGSFAAASNLIASGSVATKGGIMAQLYAARGVTDAAGLESKSAPSAQLKGESLTEYCARVNREQTPQ